MRIKSVTFEGAVAQPGAPPPVDGPQVAIAGRSNVGKSSLLNRILGRTRTPVARVSQRPGKTQEINFYRVRGRLRDNRNIEFFLVDLPGYGYARAPGSVRGAWNELIETYLTETPKLRGLIQLIDGRHDPTDRDRTMLAYLGELGLPTLFVLTKADKLKRNQRVGRLDRVAEQLGIDTEQVLFFSAVTGEGGDELLDSIAQLITMAGEA